MEKIKEWILNNGSGHGDGSGHGSGSGSGSGSGYGSCYGSGHGSGHGDGSGHGSGYGYGDGSGHGSGYGSCYGHGSGSGSGSGDGSGHGHDIASFQGKDVYDIDGVQTIIEQIKDSFARGFILNDDFTLTPCWIAKGNGYFAHGKTIKEARDALRAKIFENMDSEAAIEEFVKRFKKGEKYPGTEFFEWHHYLTGSCLMGREAFVRNHGLSLNDTYTVDEFISLCEDDYGGEIIRQLKERWKAE